MNYVNRIVLLLVAAILFMSTFAIAGIVMSGQLPDDKDASSGISDETRLRIVNSYGKLPLSFEANRGQIDERVKFFSRGSGYSLFLTPTGAALTFTKHVEQEEKSQGIDDTALEWLLYAETDIESAMALLDRAVSEFYKEGNLK